ncbi:MAG TPA: ABC transporter permease [Candidatus Nanoarchaeia archaeon]|nr:ABC transporter permease [Candidatus Nanoarchaeia archaeon]
MTLLSDTRYIFIRYMTKLVRTPILLFFSLFQPLLFLLLFTQLLNRLSNFPGVLPPGVSYLEFAAAGILLQNAFGSALQSGNSIVADIDSGFLQKMLVTPVSRPAILLGRLSSDAFRVVVQTAIILALAYALGANVKTGVVGILGIFFTLAFFGLAWSGISLALGMKTRSSETVFAIGGVITFPLLFLSPALFPISFLPSWVQTVSMFNPVSYAVNASRAFMITGYDWGTILPAWGVIGLVAIVTMSATLYQFRKVVS